MKVKGGAINHTSIILYSTVIEEAITHNPAYEEGMVRQISDLLTPSHFSHLIHTVNRFEMRRKKIELETNPSYATVFINLS